MTSRKRKQRRNYKIALCAVFIAAIVYAAFAYFALKLPNPGRFAKKQNFDQIERMMFNVALESLDQTDATGRTSLIFFAERGNLDAVKYLVRSGANVHKVTRSGCNALSFAVQNGDIAMTKYLLAKGVDTEVQCGHLKETPLLQAVNGRKVGVIRSLIGHGANLDYIAPNQRMTIGMRILESFPGDKAFEREVASRSSHPNFRTNDGVSLLQMVVDSGNKDALRILLNRGANPNMTLTGDETILYHAAAMNNVPALNLLIKRGARVNTINSEGWAPITVAAANGHYDAVVFLAGKGARLNPERSSSQLVPVSPLFMAAINGKKDVVQHLVNRGAVLSDIQEANTVVSSVLQLDSSKNDICKILATAGLIRN